MRKTREQKAEQPARDFLTRQAAEDEQREEEEAERSEGTWG